jgi:hypothetical protein
MLKMIFIFCIVCIAIFGLGAMIVYSDVSTKLKFVKYTGVASVVIAIAVAVLSFITIVF